MRNKWKLAAIGLAFAALATAVSVAAAVLAHLVVWAFGGGPAACAFASGWLGCFAGTVCKDAIREAEGG